MMEDFVTLEMLVKKSVADEVTQKGLAEIALRRADAKFKAMVKCRILGDAASNDGIPRRVVASAMQLSIPGTNSMESIRGMIRAFEKDLRGKVNRLWNGGNGRGLIRLYERSGRELVLIDEIVATHVGCEYGEYDS